MYPFYQTVRTNGPLKQHRKYIEMIKIENFDHSKSGKKTLL